MMATHDKKLDAREVQLAIGFVLKKAQSQEDAEKGALAAALSVMVATYGPVAAVDRLRDCADLIERDLILPRGDFLQ